MIPTVSNGFLMVSHLSERVETVFISQLAYKGLIKDALRSTLISLMSTPCLSACWTSLAYHCKNSYFKRALNWSLMPTSRGCNSPVQLAGTKT